MIFANYIILTEELLTVLNNIYLIVYILAISEWLQIHKSV